MPIPPEKMSVLWDGHLARLSYFCKRSTLPNPAVSKTDEPQLEKKQLLPLIKSV